MVKKKKMQLTHIQVSIYICSIWFHRPGSRLSVTLKHKGRDKKKKKWLTWVRLCVCNVYTLNISKAALFCYRNSQKEKKKNYKTVLTEASGKFDNRVCMSEYNVHLWFLLMEKRTVDEKFITYAMQFKCWKRTHIS